MLSIMGFRHERLVGLIANVDFYNTILYFMNPYIIITVSKSYNTNPMLNRHTKQF